MGNLYAGRSTFNPSLFKKNDIRGKKMVTRALMDAGIPYKDIKWNNSQNNNAAYEIDLKYIYNGEVRYAEAEMKTYWRVGITSDGFPIYGWFNREGNVVPLPYGAGFDKIKLTTYNKSYGNFDYFLLCEDGQTAIWHRHDDIIKHPIKSYNVEKRIYQTSAFEVFNKQFHEIPQENLNIIRLSEKY